MRRGRRRSARAGRRRTLGFTRRQCQKRLLSTSGPKRPQSICCSVSPERRGGGRRGRQRDEADGTWGGDRNGDIGDRLAAQQGGSAVWLGDEHGRLLHRTCTRAHGSPQARQAGFLADGVLITARHPQVAIAKHARASGRRGPAAHPLDVCFQCAPGDLRYGVIFKLLAGARLGRPVHEAILRHCDADFGRRAAVFAHARRSVANQHLVGGAPIGLRATGGLRSVRVKLAEPPRWIKKVLAFLAPSRGGRGAPSAHLAHTRTPTHTHTHVHDAELWSPRARSSSRSSMHFRR